MAFNAHGQIEDAEILNAIKLWSREFCQQCNQINAKTICVWAEFVTAKLNNKVKLDFEVRVGHNDFQSTLFCARLKT
jgi:hypothetical protein